MHYERNLIPDKLNLDELYVKSKQLEDNRIKIYRTILGRIHSKIKITSRIRANDKFCFYIVPEFLMGVPRYDVATLTSYCIDKLQHNGFFVKYTFPNLLFISWNHYIPAHRRLEYKKATGISIDGFGNVVSSKKNNNSTLTTLAKTNQKASNKKLFDFKKIDTYKPTGSLIYDTRLLKRINEKIKK